MRVLESMRTSQNALGKVNFRARFSNSSRAEWYVWRVAQESEAEVLRELQYAAYLRGRRPMGLTDLAETLLVLREYPAIAPPYSHAEAAAAVAKTAAAQGS